VKTQKSAALPQVLSRDMWQPLRDNANHSPPRGETIEQRIERLEAESAIRDLLVKYCHCYDSNDIDGVMSTFSEDCVLVNPRATFIGGEAIRRNYNHLISTRRYSFHHVTNVTVRLNQEMNEASVTSYWTDKHVGKSGSIDGSDGTYADRVKKSGNDWKISERRITANIFYVMTPYPDPWPALPEPTKKEGTRDWFGTTYVR
jgi:ketosteroid isomerase-like protein